VLVETENKQVQRSSVSSRQSRKTTQGRGLILQAQVGEQQQLEDGDQEPEEERYCFSRRFHHWAARA